MQGSLSYSIQISTWDWLQAWVKINIEPQLHHEKYLLGINMWKCPLDADEGTLLITFSSQKKWKGMKPVSLAAQVKKANDLRP